MTYKNNNIIGEESTLDDIHVDEEYINISIQLEKEQEEENDQSAPLVIPSWNPPDSIFG